MQPLKSAKNLQESDSALMMSFASGDCEGFELLYRRHSVSIYRFFFFGTHGDQILTSELFYDVWMTVVRGRLRYTNDINFKDWLYHSAWARLHDHLRLHSLDAEIDNLKSGASDSTVVSIADFYADKTNTDSDQAESDALASTSVAEVEESKVLLKAVKKLTTEQKEVVLLRFCFSMSNQDIAEFIDMSKSTIDRISREASDLLRQKVSVAPVQGDQFNG